jgi:hypothetical protein
MPVIPEIAAFLFEKFPVDAIYGLHNAPRRALGRFFDAPRPADSRLQ